MFFKHAVSAGNVFGRSDCSRSVGYALRRGALVIECVLLRWGNFDGVGESGFSDLVAVAFDDAFRPWLWLQFSGRPL